jgi:hypothetical protein
MPAFTAIRLILCATMSCSSLAIRSRSSATACWARWAADCSMNSRRSRVVSPIVHPPVTTSQPNTSPNRLSSHDSYGRLTSTVADSPARDTTSVITDSRRDWVAATR